MKDERKTKEQLINELKSFRQQIAKLGASRVKKEKAEEKLKKSEEQYKAIIQTTPDITYELDPDGNFVFVSDAIEKLGYDAGELRGKHFEQIVHPADLKTVSRSLVLPKYKGKTTGDSASPKLFDDRRTGKRMTRNLDVRLLLKNEKGVSKAYRYAEIYSTARFSILKPRRGMTRAHRHAEVDSSGKWDTDVRGKERKFLGTIGIIRDVSHHKETERKLRQSEEELRAVLENSPDLITIVDRDAKIHFTNRPVGDLETEKVIGRSLYDFVQPEYHDNYRRILPRVFRTGKVSSLVTRGVGPNGTSTWFENRLVPMKHDGQVLGVMLISTNITERKKVEEALKKAEQEKAAILSSMSELVVYQDAEMRILWANRAASESVALDPEQLVGRHCYEIWYQRNEPCVGCPVVKAHKTGQPEEGEMTSPDGREWFIRGYPVKDGNRRVTGIVEVALDITKRKKAEEKLRKSEEEFRLIFGNAKDAIFWADIETGLITNCNRAAEILLEKNRKEIVGQHQTMLHPPDKAQYYAELFKKHTGRKGAVDEEAEVMTKSGRIIPVHITASVTSIEGRPIIQGIFRDITERKKAEEALQDSEERYRAIFAQAADSIVLVDADTGALAEFNDRAHEGLGYTREEFQKLRIPDFEVIESAEEVAEHIKKVVKEGADSFETKHKRKDGEVRDILVNCRAISIAGRDFLQAMWRDITDSKKAEEKLKKAYTDLTKANEELQRLNEAKSRFLSTVSHEFRTPLAVIRSFSDILAKKKLGEVTGEQQQRLRTVVKHADYLGNLVNNLLDLDMIEAGEVKPQIQSLSLDGPVEHSVAILLPLAREKEIELEIEVDENLPPVLADEDRLVEVLSNLLSNAIKFSPRKGKVTVRAQEVQGGVQVDVADNGIGIPKEHLSKIFDQFHKVPTKEARRGWGSGLGLTIVRHLLKEQNSRIWATSELGKGSTFSFSLPKAPETE